MSVKECELKITRAKTALILDHPFFATIALGCRFKNAGEAGMPYINTMATDGRHIWWDTDFVTKLSLAETMGVICHEVLHCVFLHMFRRGHRNPLMWNVACDYVINNIVLDAGMKLPKEGCFNTKYKDWTAEAVYKDMEDDMEKISMEFEMDGPGGDGQDGDDDEGDGQGKDGKPGKKKTKLWGTFMAPKNDDGSPLSEAQVSELQAEIKIAVMQAAENAKSIGKLPGGLEGLVKALGKPVVNWKNYIPEWVSGRIPDNYQWARPNRKWMSAHNIYMPSMKVNGAGIGVLSIDNSGSVSDKELHIYVREVLGLIEMCQPTKLYIIQHDAAIQKMDIFEAGDEFESLKIKGRGGTRIRPVFDFVAGDLEVKGLESIDEQIDWMICFTDMGICDYPSREDAPDFPVLWLATGPDNAPFGTYLPIKDALEQPNQ